MNNVSSFYDASFERQSFPVITSSLSFDSLQVPEDDEMNQMGPTDRSRGMSEDDLVLGRPHCASPGEDNNEINQIRAANWMQRTLFMELEKLKKTDAETSEHPLLQNEVRTEDSETLVTGELKSKTTQSTSSILASVMNEAKFDTWQEGFSLYLQTRRRLSGAEENLVVIQDDKVRQDVVTDINSKTSTDLSPPLSPPRSLCDREGNFTQWEKKPNKGKFLFDNVDWSSISIPPTSPGLVSNARDIFAPTEPVKALKGPLNDLKSQSLRNKDGSPSILSQGSDVRKAFTGFHNYAATENASPFLGEDNSAHGGKAFTSEMVNNYQQNLSRNLKGVDIETGGEDLTVESTNVIPSSQTSSGTKTSEINFAVRPPLHGGENSKAMPIGFSDFIEQTTPSGTTIVYTIGSHEPCFLAMPGGADIFNRNETSGCSMFSVLQSIPSDAWILPYIITGSILLSQRKLSEKRLTNISFQQDQVRPSTNSSGRNSVDSVSRSRSSSDLATVSEDDVLSFHQEAGNRSMVPSYAQWSEDVAVGLNIDDDSPSQTYSMNPFKFFNHFRHKSKASKVESSVDTSQKIARRNSFDENSFVERGRNNGRIGRVTSHNDIIAGTGSIQDLMKPRVQLGWKQNQRNSEISSSDYDHQGIYGDLIVSHDEKGVYLSSSLPSDQDIAYDAGSSPNAFQEEDRNYNRSQQDDEHLQTFAMNRTSSLATGTVKASQMISLIPHFISSLFQHPNCTNLGKVLICRNYSEPHNDENKSNSIDNLWEGRQCFLWDNYVFELLPKEGGNAVGIDWKEGNRPVGYINLSGAALEFTGINAFASSAGKPRRGRSSNREDPSSGLAPVISLRYFASASPTAARRTIVLRCSTRRGTLSLMQQLETASKFTIEDLYEYDKLNEKKPDLGIGRYSRCFRALNKRTRERTMRDYDHDDVVAGYKSYEQEEVKSATSALSIKNAWKGAIRKIKKKKKKKKKKIKSKTKDSLDEPEDEEVPDPSLKADHFNNEYGNDLDGDYIGLDGHRHIVHDGNCALKVVNKKAYWDRVRSGKERGDSLAREIIAQCHILNTVIANANHGVSPSPLTAMSIEDENKHFELPIVQLYGMFETRDYFVMEMELMQNLDLSEKFKEMGEFSEEQAKHIAVQLVQAVALCQVNGMAHRDIKLTNICFPVRTNNAMLPDCQDHTSSSTTPLQIKLADFGMAGFVEKDGKLRGRCGTPGYVAPEILKSGKHEGYDLGVDMFSVGCVIYTLLCGYEPFYGETDAELIAANKQGEYSFPLPEWGRVSEEAKDFVGKLLDPFPTRRLTVHEALDHPWLSAYGGIINYPPKFVTSSSSNCVIS